MTTINAVGNGLSGITGSGNFVGSTSPTLVTPTLGVASATSINFGGNALSIYATGSFTPSFVGSGGGSATYSIQNGQYTNIGNYVFFSVNINISASTLSGNISISGLPITVNLQTAVSVTGFSMGASATPSLMALAQSSSTNIILYTFTGGNATQLTATNLGSTASIYVTGGYLR